MNKKNTEETKDKGLLLDREAMVTFMHEVDKDRKLQDARHREHMDKLDLSHQKSLEAMYDRNEKLIQESRGKEKQYLLAMEGIQDTLKAIELHMASKHSDEGNVPQATPIEPECTCDTYKEEPLLPVQHIGQVSY